MDVPKLVVRIQCVNWGPAANGNQYFSPKGSLFGGAPRNLLQGPGINNWDFQLSKGSPNRRGSI
jgi:hypothetical protein